MVSPILLPAPVSPKAFTLGQLLSDPLDTSSLSYISPTGHSTVKSHIETCFTALLSHDDEGRLISSISQSSLPLPPSQLLLVQADRMEFSALKHPIASFDSIRQDEAAHPFFRTIASKQQPLYYVVGMQTLRNPVFKQAVVQEGSIAEAKTGDKIRLPIHMRRDSAMGIDAASNDALIGLQLAKVKCRVGPTDEPHSVDDLDYHWTYHKLDSDGPQLAIGLGKALEARELRKMAGMVCEEDFVDERSAEDDFDEEGLAGF